ncbi:hypothetical protein O9992_08165 [Vibrio lentus]|nr:hypothetical protein [Vibrio lentus]
MNQGEAVGVIAAQSIGEPGTQHNAYVPHRWCGIYCSSREQHQKLRQLVL